MLTIFVFPDNLVKDLTKSLEKQLADRGPKKPLGGVTTLPERKDKAVVRELKVRNPLVSSLQGHHQLRVT